MKIYTTIGVYCDGSYKVNGVEEADIRTHVEYNKVFRFGRALIVDGEIVNLGYFKKEALEKIIKEKGLGEIRKTSCTAPYV